MERNRQQALGITCQQSVDMYTDFIFVNRFGHVQHQGTLNKAIKRIVRDCNYEVLEKNPDAKVLLPPFSCHTLRHTFTTRLCKCQGDSGYTRSCRHQYDTEHLRRCDERCKAEGICFIGRLLRETVKLIATTPHYTIYYTKMPDNCVEI